MSPGSKIAEVMEDGKFPELVQALLGDNNTKDIEQLKVKAVLEYDNGTFRIKCLFIKLLLMKGKKYIKMINSIK